MIGEFIIRPGSMKKAFKLFRVEIEELVTIVEFDFCFKNKKTPFLVGI